MNILRLFKSPKLPKKETNEDIEYFKNKVLNSLGIPKYYLTKENIKKRKEKVLKQK